MKTALCLSITVTFAASFTLHAQDADTAAMRATVSAVRSGGTTLTDWLTARPGEDRDFADRVVNLASFDWSACPSITLDEARRLLGPENGAKLLANDGWGHALEYCLRSGGAAPSRHTVGVRSPGKDGTFDAGPYRPSGFDESQTDHDVVWIDGIFVTWPEKRN